jgi:hypothetical protein
MSLALGGSYGLGYIAGVPSGSYPVPVIFGFLKDISFDHDPGSLKTIAGGWRFPVMAGRGEGKITGKASSASIFGNTLGYLYGVTPTTGVVVGAPGQVATIPTTPFQITVTNSATWVADHGVLNLTNGTQMHPAASPSAGHYSVAAGVYTFDTSDAGDVVSIAYSYTIAATGQTNAILNAYQGLSDGFELVAFNPGPTTATPLHVLGVRCPCAHISKLTHSMKVGDWATQDLSFELTMGTDGTIMSVYTGM